MTPQCEKLDEGIKKSILIKFYMRLVKYQLHHCTLEMLLLPPTSQKLMPVTRTGASNSAHLSSSRGMRNVHCIGTSSCFLLVAMQLLLGCASAKDLVDLEPKESTVSDNQSGQFKGSKSFE